MHICMYAGQSKYSLNDEMIPSFLERSLATKVRYLLSHTHTHTHIHQQKHIQTHTYTICYRFSSLESLSTSFETAATIRNGSLNSRCLWISKVGICTFSPKYNKCHTPTHVHTHTCTSRLDFFAFLYLVFGIVLFICKCLCSSLYFLSVVICDCFCSVRFVSLFPLASIYHSASLSLSQ